MYLRNTDIFASSPPDSLMHLAAVAEEISVPKGETIFDVKDMSEYLYLVVSGKVRISSADKEIFVAHPKDSFGLLGLVTEQPRVTTATSEVDTLLLSVGYMDLFDLMEDYPDIMRGVLKGLTQVLKELL